MSCYHPLDAWQRCVGAKPVFKFRPNFAKLLLPCGQCIGCRLERSRQWAMRCVHESSLYEDNSFITLTYSDDFLPSDNSLSKREWQLFMKSFRKAIYPATVRFFMCGEYGDQLSRPHYHACLFGYDFPDKTLWSVRDGVSLYRSAFLESIWKKGFCTIGDVTFESAAYVARYITKKVTGDQAAIHYEALDTSTGEVISRLPEFTLMSRRPGVGSDWYDRFSSDLDKDFLVMRGVRMRPPKFYDRKLQAVKPEVFDELKLKRKSSALVNSFDNTPDRLLVKERIKLNRFDSLKRGYENET